MRQTAWIVMILGVRPYLHPSPCGRRCRAAADEGRANSTPGPSSGLRPPSPGGRRDLSPRKVGIGLSALAFLFVWWIAPALAETDGPFALADIPAYRAALAPNQAQDRANLVSFRDLWDRPEVFQGRRVRVEGRAVVIFHRKAVGQFPALAEIWIYNEASDPFCLVCPEVVGKPTPKPGAMIEFEGTFLRKVRYQGGDVDRLAPLIVGPEVPQIHRQAAEAPKSVGSPFSGWFIVVIGGVVVLTFVRVMLRRPRRKAIIEDPPPLFTDGKSSNIDP